MTDWSDIRVSIIGLAREGTALARYLARHGARVTGSDLKGPAQLNRYLDTLDGLPIQLVLGSHPAGLLEADIIFVSPGVPADIPFLKEARRRGVPLSTETRLVCQRAPGLVVGITGSSGKTTTTALVGEMLRASGFHTWVGGNIGHPLVGHLDAMQRDDRIVMELSSFQLEYFRPITDAEITSKIEPLCTAQGVGPDVAAILNITPNHLDRHPSMEAYIEAKRTICQYGPPQAIILGADDPITRDMAQELHLSQGRKVLFSTGRPLSGPGAYLREDGWVIRQTEEGGLPICRRAEIRLRGEHNVRNVVAACAISGEAGAAPEAQAEVIRTFQGIPHRLEMVREWQGARWYNDSIATTPERTVAALRSFEEPIILLAGGRDKHLPWEEMATLTWQKARALILFGEAAPLIKAAMEQAAQSQPDLKASGLAIRHCQDLEEAVHQAARLAQPGDVVLLSPGGTSYDAYRDFEERGEHFRRLVARLEEG